MTRLTRRINLGTTEVDNLSKAAKAQAKRLSKLRKDLAALQEARVRAAAGRRAWPRSRGGQGLRKHCQPARVWCVLPA
jgi:hypothetical protein